MTLYARVADGAIVRVGAIPAGARRTDDGAWVTPLGGVWTEVEANACGWFIVVETARPDDTATDTYEPSYALVGGVPTQSWVAQPKPVEQVNRETIEAQAVTALANNTSYLGINNPNTAQVVAQVEALTRQNNKIIRLILGRLESTD